MRLGKGNFVGVVCPTCHAGVRCACVTTRGKHVGGRVHSTHPARVRVAIARGVVREVRS